MVTSVKMMQGKYLHKLSNVLSIYILRKSHIEISNLKTSSWILPKHWKWRLLILAYLISGKIQWEKSSSFRKRINWSGLLITLHPKLLTWIMMNVVIFGLLELYFTFWSQLLLLLMEIMTRKLWKMWRKWNLPSIVLCTLCSSLS